MSRFSRSSIGITKKLYKVQQSYIFLKNYGISRFYRARPLKISRRRKIKRYEFGGPTVEFYRHVLLLTLDQSSRICRLLSFTFGIKPKEVTREIGRRTHVYVAGSFGSAALSLSLAFLLGVPMHPAPKHRDSRQRDDF